MTLASETVFLGCRLIYKTRTVPWHSVPSNLLCTWVVLRFSNSSAKSWRRQSQTANIKSDSTGHILKYTSFLGFRDTPQCEVGRHPSFCFELQNHTFRMALCCCRKTRLKVIKYFSGTVVATSREHSIFSDGEAGDPQAWGGNEEAVIWGCNFCSHPFFIQHSCPCMRTVRPQRCL